MQVILWIGRNERLVHAIKLVDQLVEFGWAVFTHAAAQVAEMAVHIVRH
jgi:hypothetical protein